MWEHTRHLIINSDAGKRPFVKSQLFSVHPSPFALLHEMLCLDMTPPHTTNPFLGTLDPALYGKKKRDAVWFTF